MTSAQRTRVMRTLWITAICLATAGLARSVSSGLWAVVDVVAIMLAAWWLTV